MTDVGGTEELTETTVGRLGPARVGVSNIFRDSYELPGGEKRKGATAGLTIMVAGEAAIDLRVGEGSTVEAGDTRWEVARVRTGLLRRHRRGLVELRRIE